MELCIHYGHEFSQHASEAYLVHSIEQWVYLWLLHCTIFSSKWIAFRRWCPVWRHATPTCHFQILASGRCGTALSSDSICFRISKPEIEYKSLISRGLHSSEKLYYLHIFRTVVISKNKMYKPKPELEKEWAFSPNPTLQVLLKARLGKKINGGCTTKSFTPLWKSQPYYLQSQFSPSKGNRVSALINMIYSKPKLTSEYSQPIT